MRSSPIPLAAGWLVALAVLASACGDGAAPANPALTGPRLHGGDDTPTNLRISKTAVAARTRDVAYDWTVEKSVTPASANLATGASHTFTYTVAATRTESSVTEAVTVAGEICVQNVGGGATANLTVTDNVQASTNGGATWSTIATAAVDISAQPQIAGGSSWCYPYEVAFTPVAGAVYRNEAYVTITNASGYPLGQLSGFERYAPFTLPDAVTTTETDETAWLADVLTCPAGFTCTPSPGGWALTGTSTTSYDVTITNVSAPCAHTGVAENTATLTEGDSGETRTGGAAVTLTTSDCAPPTGFQGCTPGYWKQKHHFGNWTGYVPVGPGASRYDASFGVTLLGPSTTLLEALSTGGGGVSRFGRHSTAALLNASSGAVAYGMTPAQVVAAVQDAVATGAYDAASDHFERLNERHCPLGRG